MKNDINDNVYYTYIYLDPRKPGNYVYDNYIFDYEPFHVGKGKGQRCIAGLKDYKSGRKSHKIYKLLKIHESNNTVIIKKIIEHVSNAVACSMEIELIKLIGRADKKLGPLTNNTDGGDGALGTKHTKEWIDMMSIPVLQYSLDGVLINEYNSLTNAANAINITSIQISKVCRKLPRYKTAGGFKWEFKEKNMQGHILKRNKRINHTEDTKQKMRKPKNWKTPTGCHPNKGKFYDTKYPPILQYDLNMQLIKEWSNINILCKENNYHIGYMMTVLRNKKNYAYKNYWKFKIQ